MNNWVKNTVMLVVLVIWGIAVLVQLPELPDPVTWGIPGGIYALLNTSRPSRRREASQSTTEVTDV